MSAPERLRPVLLTLLVLGALSACGGPQARYASHLERGKRYLAAGDLARAGLEFRNALQIQPKGADALALDAQLTERSGNFRAALSLYRAALDVEPDLVPARAGLASIYVAGGMPAKALALLEPGLAKSPNSVDLLVARAAARTALNDLSGARADAQRCLQLDPTNGRAVALLAGLYRSAKEFPAAIALVSNAVTHTPGSVELREILAQLYFDTRNTGDGEQQLRKLIELRPHDSVYRDQLARALVYEHRIDAAQRVMEEAVQADPRSMQAKIALSDFVSAQRSAAAGEKILRDFLAREPANEDLRLGLGQLLLQHGKAAEALQTYGEVAAREGDQPRGLVARDRMAELEASLGRDADAEKILAEVLKYNPQDDDALAVRGRLSAQHDDPEAAIADLRAVLRDHPDATAIRETLARVYLADGQIGLAVEALRNIVDSSPGDIPARIELAAVLARSNRADEAVSLLEAAVKAAPTDARARQALVRAYMAKGDLTAAQSAAEALKAQWPADGEGHYLAGLVAKAQKRLSVSESELRQALALNPHALDALMALTSVELARGETEQAYKDVQSAMAADPKDPLPANLLGELYLAKGDLAGAERAFVHVTQLAPRWGVAYRDLAHARLAGHDTAGAIGAYQAGLREAPGDVLLGAELAALYEHEGRTGDAIAELDDVHRLNPRDQRIAASLAMLLVSYRSDARSLDRARDLTAALAASNDPVVLDSAGWVQFKRGEFAAAAAALQKAEQRAPNAKEIRYHLAMAELRIGERDRARSDLEAALSGTHRFVGDDNARTTLASLKNSAG